MKNNVNWTDTTLLLVTTFAWVIADVTWAPYIGLISSVLGMLITKEIKPYLAIYLIQIAFI